MLTALFCFLSDTKQSGASTLSKLKVSNDQAELDDGRSPQTVENSASQQKTEEPVDYVESEGANKDTGVIEGAVAKERDGPMDDESPPAGTDPEREDVSDVHEVNEASTEVPQTTDANGDKANGRDAEEAKADAIIEPSGEEESFSSTGKEEENEAVTDKPDAPPGHPQSSVSDGGMDEGTASVGEANVDEDEPVDADHEELKDEKDDKVREREEPMTETEDDANIERHGVEEMRTDEEEDETKVLTKEGDGVNDEDNDNIEGCGTGEVGEGGEPAKATDDDSNIERSDHDNIEENGEGAGKESSSSVQPEAEES